MASITFKLGTCIVCGKYGIDFDPENLNLPVVLKCDSCNFSFCENCLDLHESSGCTDMEEDNTEPIKEKKKFVFISEEDDYDSDDDSDYEP